MKGKQRNTHLDFIQMPAAHIHGLAWFTLAAAAMASSRNPGCLSGCTCEMSHFGLLSVTFKIARASASLICPSFAMGTASTKLINSSMAPYADLTFEPGGLRSIITADEDRSSFCIEPRDGLRHRPSKEGRPDVIAIDYLLMAAPCQRGSSGRRGRSRPTAR